MGSSDLVLSQVFRLIAPEAVLVITAFILFLFSTLKGGTRTLAGLVALAGLSIALSQLVTPSVPTGLADAVTASPTIAPIVPGPFGEFIRWIAWITGLLLVIMNWNECEGDRACDYHACLLSAVAGVSLVGVANDLIVLFLALELISIPTYVMLYLPGARRDVRMQESAVKYFMLSVSASAFTLFGLSYWYGVTGTTNITASMQLLTRSVGGDLSTMALIAAVMVLAGMGFRITAFPFHFYAPDVYQGGPTGTVAFLAFAPKVAGFAALIKLFGTIGDAGPIAGDFVKRIMMLLWILAAVTMTAGNVLGVLQNNLRRMLAYSGVANAGYMLVGLALLPAQSYRDGEFVAGAGEGLLFYLIAYGFMTIGAFAVLAHLNSAERPIETVDDLAGLRESHPYSAAVLGLIFLSLIGLPGTAGFAGKFMLFVSAMAAPATAPMQDLFRVLAVVLAINAAIGAYYYLRVIMSMFLRSSLNAPQPKNCCCGLFVGAVCAIAGVVFGLMPGPIVEAARKAVGAG